MDHLCKVANHARGQDGTFSFYNKSLGTFFHLIYSVRVCISHYVLLLDYDSRMSKV